MKNAYKLIAMALALGLGPAFGQGQVEIGRMLLGSGEPGQPGMENATAVYNNVYHAAQYLPGFPTAATIWPRVIEVPCRQVEARLQCDGYNWTPRMGRGEYLYFTPIVLAARPVAEAPVTVPQEQVAPVVAAPAEPPPPEATRAMSGPSKPPGKPAKPKSRAIGKQDRH